MARATTTRTLFRMEVGIAIDIAAPPERVWALLTDAARIPAWNSTVDQVTGTIAEGERIEVKVPVAPERVFKLRVSDVVAPRQMTWSDGFAPMFRGVRTYDLAPADGGVTRFAMREVFSGLMLPLIAGSLPDFGPVFEQYAADLKVAAEATPEGAEGPTPPSSSG